MCMCLVISNFLPKNKSCHEEASCRILANRLNAVILEECTNLPFNVKAGMHTHTILLACLRVSTLPEEQSLTYSN